MQERLELLQDLKGVLKFFRRDDNARYLLVIKPKNMLEEASIETQVNGIKSYIEEKLQNTEELINTRLKD